MRKALCGLIMLCLVMESGLAKADFFALEVQGQGGYTRLSNIELPGTTETGVLAGGTAGVRGRVQLLFINAIVDYQHFFNNADMLHAGLGFRAGFDVVPVIKPYVIASAGVLMLTAEAGAFSPKAQQRLDPQTGFMARAGGGLRIPIIGDWLSLGVGVDVGIHYITGKVGYNLSAMGLLGIGV